MHIAGIFLHIHYIQHYTQYQNISYKLNVYWGNNKHFSAISKFITVWALLPLTHFRMLSDAGDYIIYKQKHNQASYAHGEHAFVIPYTLTCW